MLFELTSIPLLLPAVFAGSNVCSSCDSVAKALDGPQCEKYPFCVTGLVLQANHSEVLSELTLRDDSGTCLVKGEPCTAIRPWQIVAVTGALPNSHSTYQHAWFDTVTPLGTGSPVAPQPADAQDVLSGKVDWRLIRISGTLQDAFLSELNPKWAFVTLNCNGTCIHAATPNNGQVLRQLTAQKDAIVDLSGVSMPYDGSLRTKIGRMLHFSDIHALRIVQPPPADPFDVPDIKAIATLPAPVISTLDRHSAKGRLLAVWDDGAQALLRTPEGSIVKVSFSQAQNARAGDFVRVAGLPESDLQHINLTSAILRPDRAFDCPDAPTVVLSPNQLLSDKAMIDIASWYGHPVRLEGILRNKPAAGSPYRLFYLSVNDRLVPIDFSAAPHVLDSIELESRIEATGICVMDIENWRLRQTFPRINGFFTVLRSSEDIRVVSRPPWWTPQHMLAVIGALLTIIVAVIIWNAALRHAATRKGRELFREQLGHVRADLKTEERTRLAVELHDTLAQNLTGVSMEIEAAHELRGNAPQPMLDHLGIAAKALKSCRDELRNCLWDLRSQALEEQDMTKAVLKTLQPVVNDSRLAVRFNVPRAQLSDNTAHALLRVIRELVINAIRHGNAGSVKVAGTIDSGKLLCSVTDDGCGFDPEAAPGVLQGHFGLQGIQERIDELGGTFEIASAPGSGTKATISVPIPHEC